MAGRSLLGRKQMDARNPQSVGLPGLTLVSNHPDILHPHASQTSSSVHTVSFPVPNTSWNGVATVRVDSSHE